MADERNKPQNPSQPQPQAAKPPEPPRQDAPRQQSPEDWLRGKGWEYKGKNRHERDMWADPKGTMEPAVKVQVGELPARDDGGGVKFMPLLQPVGGPLPWDFETKDAVSIQRSRDFDEEVTSRHVPALKRVYESGDLKALRAFCPQGCQVHMMFLDLKRQLCDRLVDAEHRRLVEAAKAMGRKAG